MKPFNYSVDKDGLKIKGSGMSTLRLEMVLACPGTGGRLPDGAWRPNSAHPLAPCKVAMNPASSVQ